MDIVPENCRSTAQFMYASSKKADPVFLKKTERQLGMFLSFLTGGYIFAVRVNEPFYVHIPLFVGIYIN
jgi:hypothetical protein